MIDRRRFVVVLAGTVAGPGQAHAQPGGAPARIGYLSMAPRGGDASWVAAFRNGLRDLGYIEGRNILVEERHAAQHPDRVPALLAELLALKVRVVVTYSTQHIAKSLAGTTPIVFTVDPDPVGNGLVASLARPGGTITGLADAHGDLVPKRLALLKEVVPGLTRVAVLYNPQTPHAVRQLGTAEAVAPSLALQIVARGVEHHSQIEPALAAVAALQPGAVLAIPDPTWAGAPGRPLLGDGALRYRLPVISTVRETAEAGVLLAYGTNFHDLWRRAATYVDKILKGAQPADLPVEQPTHFDLVVNMRTAKALGLVIPTAILARADEVIE